MYHPIPNPSSFVICEHHNLRYAINSSGEVFDRKRGIFLKPKKYHFRNYQTVSLKKGAGSFREHEVPRLVYIYFVDDSIGIRDCVRVKDASLPISPENLETYNNSRERGRGSKKAKEAYKNSPKRITVDPDFVNWNEDAIYC